MSWTRLDDNWCTQMTDKGLSVDAMWHYLCLIQRCSRSNRWDGVLDTLVAERESIVRNSAGALNELVSAGLLKPLKDGYEVVRIEDHIPPDYLRDEKRKAASKVRQDRSRAHRKGDHSLCRDDAPCRAVTQSEAIVTRDKSVTTTGHATRDAGTGQDRTALEVSATRGDTTTHPGGSSSPACVVCSGWGDPDGCEGCGVIGVGPGE